jgi:hypothetical protein
VLEEITISFEAKEKQTSEYCYKIVQSGRYVLIQGEKHIIRGLAYFVFTFKDISD